VGGCARRGGKAAPWALGGGEDDGDDAVATAATDDDDALLERALSEDGLGVPTRASAACLFAERGGRGRRPDREDGGDRGAARKPAEATTDACAMRDAAATAPVSEALRCLLATCTRRAAALLAAWCGVVVVLLVAIVCPCGSGLDLIFGSATPHSAPLGRRRDGRVRFVSPPVMCCGGARGSRSASWTVCSTPTISRSPASQSI
jgi:hypothetical protein